MELGPPPPRNSIDRKPEIDSLLSEIEKGRIGSNALSTLDAYVWPRVGQLITAICSCDDDHKTLLGLKYELKALLKIRQDFKRDENMGQVAEENLKKYYSKKPIANGAGGQ